MRKMPEYMHAGGRAGKTWMCGETWRRALREQTRNIEKNAAYNNAEAKGKKRVFFKAEWTCARVHASHLNPRTERVKNKENVHYSHTYVLPDIFPHSPPSSGTLCTFQAGSVSEVRHTTTKAWTYLSRPTHEAINPPCPRTEQTLRFD